MTRLRDDYAAVFGAGATEREISELCKVSPVPIPAVWLEVLRVSNGFETIYPQACPSFSVLATDILSSAAADPDEWRSTFPEASDIILPIALDRESGYFALDLETCTPDGDCAVVRYIFGYDEQEYWYNTIGEFLENSLNEADWELFRSRLPSDNRPAIGSVQALAEAARNGHVKKATELVDSGADVNALHDGSSILWHAAMGRSSAVTSFLLERGADPNLDKLECALSAAARSGCLDVVSLLIERGANVNGPDVNFGSPLGAAAAFQQDDVVSFLIAAGADAPSPQV